MKWTTSLAALWSVVVGVQATGLRSHWEFLRDSGLLPEQQDYELQERTAAPMFLNSKTKKYAVDGKGLPEVNFDIGESYAGTIDGGEGRSYFFWFVPTTNPAAKDEITIWLNGGPGCSSLDGFLHENGPVIWQAGTYLPVQNTYAWSNLTNIVWVEQPVGTGFSTGKVTAKDEIDVSNQFNGFWKNFVDTFGLTNRKVYITGESYAGQYVPYIADGMIKQNNTKYFDVNGIIVFDPSIGYDTITEQAPAVAFVDYNHNDFPFNDSFVEYIHEMSSSCGFDKVLQDGLVFPPTGYIADPVGAPGGTLKKGCNVFGEIFRAIFKINPCFDIYQVGQLCPLLWDVLGFPYSTFYSPKGYKNPYFNQTAVKQAIHAPLDVDWTICSHKPVFVGGDRSPPSGLNGGPLARVAEHTNNVVVGHGALDMVLILNGTLLTLNNLTWNGKQGFSAAPTKPFYVPYHYEPRKSSAAGAGVFGSWQTDRGLTFVSIDLSGHEVPEYQPSAGYRILELLLGRISSLSEVSAFSTQKGYPQPPGPLGMGNGPLKRGEAFVNEGGLAKRVAPPASP